MIKDKKKGFTIVEIMVVVVIFALITIVLLVAIEAARTRTRNTIIESQLEQITVIAETVYDPDDGYKELYEMRGDPVSIEDDYETVKEIRKKINEMGSTSRIWFPEDVGDVGFMEYCAFAYFIPKDRNIVLCVDSLGNEIEAHIGDINCTDLARPADCKYRE